MRSVKSLTEASCAIAPSEPTRLAVSHGGDVSPCRSMTSRRDAGFALAVTRIGGACNFGPQRSCRSMSRSNRPRGFVMPAGRMMRAACALTSKPGELRPTLSIGRRGWGALAPRAWGGHASLLREWLRHVGAMTTPVSWGRRIAIVNLPRHASCVPTPRRQQEPLVSKECRRPRCHVTLRPKGSRRWPRANPPR